MDCCGHPSNWVTNPWNLSQPRSVYQRSRIKSVTCPFLTKKWSNHQGSPFGFFTRPARGPSCDKLGAWRALPKPTHYAFLCQWIIFTHLKNVGYFADHVCFISNSMAMAVSGFLILQVRTGVVPMFGDAMAYPNLFPVAGIQDVCSCHWLTGCTFLIGVW